MADFKATDSVNRALSAAAALASDKGSVNIEPAHFTHALFADHKSLGAQALGAAGGNHSTLIQKLLERIDSYPSQDPAPEPSVSRDLAAVIKAAKKDAAAKKDDFVSADHCIVALAADRGVARGLDAAGCSADKLKAAVAEIRKDKPADSATADDNYDALSKYAINLCEQARKGKLDPVIGRDDEIRRCIQILSRRTKNNPVLVGEPGVGKTAIAEGMAQRIVNGDVPDSLRAELWSLDMGSLVAGAKYVTPHHIVHPLSLSTVPPLESGPRGVPVHPLLGPLHFLECFLFLSLPGSMQSPGSSRHVTDIVSI